MSYAGTVSITSDVARRAFQRGGDPLDPASAIRAKSDSSLTEPRRAILMLGTGPMVLLADELGRIAGIQSAFLYGSFPPRG